MFLHKLLFCVSVLSTSQITFALTEGRRCSDCVSIHSCESCLDFVRKLQNRTVTPESRQIMLNAFCGYDESDHKTPKVCCSDFQQESRMSVIDPIEDHRNIGLLPDFCGDIDGSRILNGEVAKLYEFPWMALISYNTADGPNFQCAGSIINSRYILTAAHCVIEDGRHQNIAYVRVGEFDYSSAIDCQGSFDDMICESKIQDLEVEEIIPHARFTGKPIEGADIALLRVKKAINITNNAAPVCLPLYSSLRNSDLAGKIGTVAGWGLTEEMIYSTKLMKITIPILTGDACSHYYDRNENQRTSVMETGFCAGEKLKDTCSGDSGGPLMIESDFDGPMRIVQFGIVSFGPKQCSVFPGVYTDVTKYMKWILDKIRE